MLLYFQAILRVERKTSRWWKQRIKDSWRGNGRTREGNKGELPKAVFLSPPVFLCARCGAAAPRLSRSSIAGETAFFVGSAEGIRSPQSVSPCCSLGELSVPPPCTGFDGRIGDWWLSADRGCFRPNLAATVCAAPPLHAVRSAQASVRLSIGASISVTHTHTAAVRTFLAILQYPLPPHSVCSNITLMHARKHTQHARARGRWKRSPLSLTDTVCFLKSSSASSVRFCLALSLPNRSPSVFFLLFFFCLSCRHYVTLFPKMPTRT